jgi:hypothetical protein
MKEKKMFDYRTRVTNDMMDLYQNPESPLHCDQCKASLGVMHILRYSLFKKMGVVYHVPCKSCKHRNPRTKGAYKSTVEQQWKDLEDQMNNES